MGTFLAIAGLVIVGLIALGVGAVLYIRNVRTIKPNQIGIRVGRNTAKGPNAFSAQNGASVVKVGRIRLKPFRESLFIMDTNVRQINVDVRAQSKDGIEVDIRGTADVAIDTSTERTALLAAEYYYGQEKEIDTNVRNQLEGIIRDAIGKVTAWEIQTNRAAIASTVFDNAEATYSARYDDDGNEIDPGQGLKIKTFNINSVSDDKGYFENRGKPEIAKAQQAAEIAESNAQLEISKTQNQNAITQQQLERKKAEEEATIKKETAQIKADAENAEELARIAAERRVLDANLEKEEKEQELTRQRLIRTEIEPEKARAQQLIVQRQAELEIKALEAENELKTSETRAKARQTEADAEAHAVRVAGEAKAAALQAEADALSANNYAVLRKRALEIQPDIARELSAPYNNVDSINIVGSDNASKLTETVISQYDQLNTFTQSKLGLGIDDVVSSFISPSTDTVSADN